MQPEHLLSISKIKWAQRGIYSCCLFETIIFRNNSKYTEIAIWVPRLVKRKMSTYLLKQISHWHFTIKQRRVSRIVQCWTEVRKYSKEAWTGCDSTWPQQNPIWKPIKNMRLRWTTMNEDRNRLYSSPCGPTYCFPVHQMRILRITTDAACGGGDAHSSGVHDLAFSSWLRFVLFFVCSLSCFSISLWLWSCFLFVK